MKEKFNHEEISKLIGLRDSIEKSGRLELSERLNDFIHYNTNNLIQKLRDDGYLHE